MNKSPKVILLSQVPLPFTKIGSWTTLYKNYLENDHKIDYIVCPKPDKLYNNITYSFAKLTLWHKIQQKVFKKKALEYLDALNEIIVPSEKYIIQIVDNYGIIKPLTDYLSSRGINNQCYIQFFYHGYPPHNYKDSMKDFYCVIDEIILLTNDSYIEHKKQINELPNHFSILSNGIDTKKFSRVSIPEKNNLKHQLGIGDKKVFIWCSQDRPKKGLHLILDAWKIVYASQKNIILLVIGCDPREKMEGVMFLGKIPNEELPAYYQASDCYLFPTLCQEGFGLSLIEALHCGNYCIASALGGVPEVLQYGKLGKLIEKPHFVSEWESAINDFLSGKFEIPEFSSELYSSKTWNVEMNNIIMKAKNRFNK